MEDMHLMRKIFALAAGLGLMATAAVAQPGIAERNASGFDYFWLEVPAGVNMVADGNANDWAWFDPEYVLTNDEWDDEGNREAPSRDDLDVTTLMAWKGAPENRWYVHMTIHDDTLSHEGNDIARWGGDMIAWGTNPTDGARDRGNGGISMEWYAAPGDVSPNWAYRYPTGDAEPGILAWLQYGEEPWLSMSMTVTPQEAWNTLWTSDTGGQTVYEFNLVMITELLDGGPSASQVHNLDAVAGTGGAGTQFIFWVEDGEAPGGTFNDWTVRGDVASNDQWFAHATLLRTGEYNAQTSTAVEQTTWGRIKSSF
jgi:hypothetical protein